MRIREWKTAVRARVARILPTALVVAVLILATGPLTAQSVEITLLHVNDTHSHLAAWGPKDGNLDGTLGGLPKAAAIVAAERARDPSALFVHSGDFMEGDVFFNEYLGVPELQILKSMGLDALVIGNHEFRFGPGVLAGVFQSAWGGPASGVPVLDANLSIPSDCPLLPWVSPSLIKEVNGVRVGLFGLTVHDGAMCNPAPVEILSDYRGLAQGAVDQLRGSGAQIVVVLTHFGMESARDIAANVAGIDVIVNGHDNAVLEQPEAVARPGGGTAYIVSAGHHYRWVGRLRLSFGGGEVGLVDYALLGADADTPPSPAVQAAVDALKIGIVARYGDIYHTPLARAERDITMEWNPHNAKRDTALGNLFTDAYRAWTGTDIAIEPFGFMGDPLPEGWVVGADVFRAMSYGNLEDVSGGQIARPWRLVTFSTTGSEVIKASEMTLFLGGDYFPQVSGMRYDYDSTAPPMHKVLLDTVHVGGPKIVLDQVYSVTVTEQVYLALAYVLGMKIEQDPGPQTLSAYAFDAVRALIAERGELGLATSNRIRDVAAIPGKKKAKSEDRPLRIRDPR
jgi:5'-nucleotidase/UDP-sugar diphosphatase